MQINIWCNPNKQKNWTNKEYPSIEVIFQTYKGVKVFRNVTFASKIRLLRALRKYEYTTLDIADEFHIRTRMVFIIKKPYIK